MWQHPLGAAFFVFIFLKFFHINFKPGNHTPLGIDMLPSYRTMKYKSPIWGYFHVQKE